MAGIADGDGASVPELYIGFWMQMTWQMRRGGRGQLTVLLAPLIDSKGLVTGNHGGTQVDGACRRSRQEGGALCDNRI